MLIRGYRLIIIFLIIRIQMRSMALRSMFDNTTCSITCKTHVHTMCDDIKPLGPCKFKMHVYDIDSFHEMNVKRSFILGHNGLRSRIAFRMGVVDMRALKWDKDLERMAHNYARLCTPFEDDECLSMVTFGGKGNRPKPILANGKDSQRYLSQNRFCMTSNYFPRELNIIAMREWYFEKNKLQPPVEHIGIYSQKFKVLLGKSNFTHLSYEITYRFGCSIARYDNLYCTFCFYYPFFHTRGDVVVFKIGNTASDCPSDFPYKDQTFPNLCDDGKEDYGLASPCVKFAQRDRVLLILAVFLLSVIFKKMFT